MAPTYNHHTWLDILQSHYLCMVRDKSTLIICFVLYSFAFTRCFSIIQLHALVEQVTTSFIFPSGLI